MRIGAERFGVSCRSEMTERPPEGEGAGLSIGFVCTVALHRSGTGDDFVRGGGQAEGDALFLIHADGSGQIKLHKGYLL